MKKGEQPGFLPINRKDLRDLGIDQPDIIIISGDAYVDHPSFASALLGRALWDAGFTVAVLPQPDWKNPDSYKALGSPRLFFAVSAGSVDSMVSNYTPARKKRQKDAYSPGGRLKRPDRALLVYTDHLHRLFPDSPIVIGGIEASLRRFAHYDYWSDRIRQSVLADAPADVLVYGMGENALCTIAKRADQGEHPREMHDITGTVWKIPPKEYDLHVPPDAIELPSFTDVRDNSADFCHAHITIQKNQNPVSGRTLVQRHPKTIIIQNRPGAPLSTEEMDRLYDLPFQRASHPSYREEIPALIPVRFSITSHRGCYGDCNFCAISMHQGRIIQSRSAGSIFAEIASFKGIRGFSGVISDIGGPSANMYGDYCPQWKKEGPCPDRSCLTCKSLHRGTGEYLDLLDKAEALEGIKHVFIGSGLRYDLIPADPDVMERISKHISGQMKVAPEHIVPHVTRLMNKPDGACFDAFRESFEKSQKGKKPRQYLVPYLMSGHPGCNLTDMVTLAEYLRDTRLYTEQVQDFTPTPMTTSTCMYASRTDPVTGKVVHVPRDEEKRIQRALLHWKDPENYSLVLQGLKTARRTDLIGTTEKSLITPYKKGDIRDYRKKSANYH